MTIVTERYIRKPLYVDAVQVTEENMEEIAAWCQGDMRVLGAEDWTMGDEAMVGSKYVHVRVHSPRSPRQTKAFAGDWILYTERGYKVYTTRAFEASFDPVTSGAPS
jgi:hypothetical protein